MRGIGINKERTVFLNQSDANCVSFKFGQLRYYDGKLFNNITFFRHLHFVFTCSSHESSMSQITSE